MDAGEREARGAVEGMVETYGRRPAIAGPVWFEASAPPFARRGDVVGQADGRLILREDDGELHAVDPREVLPW